MVCKLICVIDFMQAWLIAEYLQIVMLSNKMSAIHVHEKVKKMLLEFLKDSDMFLSDDIIESIIEKVCVAVRWHNIM